jgi:hypothetical protein
MENQTIAFMVVQGEREQWHGDGPEGRRRVLCYSIVYPVVDPV